MGGLAGGRSGKETPRPHGTPRGGTVRPARRGDKPRRGTTMGLGYHIRGPRVKPTNAACTFR